MLAIMVALVSTPSVWACATALFTPAQSPKSSAFTMIRLSISSKFKPQKQQGQLDFTQAYAVLRTLRPS
jgi:hypothetical protein